jgi:O-antigen/teichoic acid export membrane protein
MGKGGVARTANIKKQIVRSVIFKGLTLLCSLLTVPLAINYLGTEKYGIWITVSSIVAWATFVDFGLGHGIRNKVAESLAKDDASLARSYVSTGYFAVSIISLLLILVIVPISYYIDWQSILNTTAVGKAELRDMFIIAIIFVLINFIFSLVNALVSARQKTSLLELNQLMMNVLWVLAIYLLSVAGGGHLVYLVLATGIVSLVTSLTLTLYFFKHDPGLIPQIKFIEMSRLRETSSLGGKFFIIQIAVLVIFTTDNLIIIQLLGPEEVTTYSIVYKIFGLITMANGIVTAGLWSAYTEAFHTQDYEWIKRVIKKLNMLMIPIILIVVLLVFIAKPIIGVWLQRELDISNSLLIFCGLYTIVSIWNLIYAYFLNGIGAVNLQMYLAIFAAIINIPVSILFVNYFQMGSAGVILATSVSLSFFAIAGPIQTMYILKKMKKA